MSILLAMATFRHSRNNYEGQGGVAILASSDCMAVKVKQTWRRLFSLNKFANCIA